MAKVKITIAGRDYSLSCADGDEDRVRELGALIDFEASAIASKMSFVSETNLLVMAALQMADQASSSGVGSRAATGLDGTDDAEGFDDEALAQLLNGVAEDIESVAASLNKG